MELHDLGFNRNLQKNPVQNNETKDTVFTSSNPTRKTGGSSDNDPAHENDDGSKNVLTGTRIISCFIQTSGYPYRVEIADNDITFFDDTYTESGVVKGNTSRLVFTHDIDSGEGFIFEKRSSVYNTYDNVLSIYATSAKTGNHNYLFIGRSATSGDEQNHTNVVVFNVDLDTSLSAPPPAGQKTLNGVFRIEFSQDGVSGLGDVPLQVGASRTISSGVYASGFAGVLGGGDGGVAALGYKNTSSKAMDLYVYILSDKIIHIGSSLLPDGGGYNLGSPSAKFGTFYGSVSACPLPTVDDALAVLDTISEPTFVGDRGHYGDRKYFDDIGFPTSLLWENSDGHVDIEHNHMIGFLLKVVKELKAEVDTLKRRLP